MKCIVYIATSIDGYIATKSGDVDWLMEVDNPHNDDFGFGKFIDSIDALVMGRNTYEKVLSFDNWPYTKPVYLLSSTIKSVPVDLKGKVIVVNKDIPTLLSNLEEQGMKRLYIDGGFVIQSFLERDLIDEMIITRVPTVLGEGISLFRPMEKRLKFEHIKTEVLLGELVMSQYKRK